MDNTIGAIISCIGSVMAAAISAYATILVAKINKDEILRKRLQPTTEKKEHQRTEVFPQKQGPPEAIALPNIHSKQIASDVKETVKSIANNLPSKRQSTLLVTSNLLILVMICTISGLTLVKLESPYLLVFAGIFLVFGISATFIRSKLVTNIALVLNSIIILIQMTINLFYFAIFFIAMLL